MARALLITVDDVLRFSNINGNVDTDKIIQFISIAQDLHIEQILGTDLLAKIEADIISSGAPAGNYLTLTNNWIKKALIHWTIVEFLSSHGVQVSNGGLFRHQPENANPITEAEAFTLIDKYRNYATYYSNRLHDYLCNNSTLFPEYNSNSNEDIRPNGSNNFTSWVL